MPFFYSVSKAAKILGVSTKTIRRWDAGGIIKTSMTPGGHRRISDSEINRILKEKDKLLSDESDSEGFVKNNRAFIYARVSTKKKADSGNLERQKDRLTAYASENGYDIVGVFSEVASGVNENRSQLMKMLNGIRDKKADFIIVEYKDRLARFGYSYINKYVEDNGAGIIIVNEVLETDAQQELVDDLIAIVTAFSARIYGKRSGQNFTKDIKKMLCLEGDTYEDCENPENKKTT